MYNTNSTVSISKNRRENFPTCRKPKPDKYSTRKENSTAHQIICKRVKKKKLTNQYSNLYKNKTPQKRLFSPRMQGWHIWISTNVFPHNYSLKRKKIYYKIDIVNLFDKIQLSPMTKTFNKWGIHGNLFNLIKMYKNSIENI